MASDGGSSTLKVGGVVAYIQWLWLLFQPIKQMGSRFAVLQSALAAVNKVHQIMTLPLPADDGDQEPESLDLKVDDVTFAYNGDELVLQHVTLDVPRGSSRALVGPTGAGKSTLIRLLTRQYDIAEGRGDITIGGLSIKAVPRERLKHLIVLVPQEPAIFRESVFYNIGLNRPEITREQVTAVCEKIQADRFIRNLSDGYDTLLASDGSNLSMGQRQLVALARALVSDAEILIFDEATANIDTETELMIQNALDYAMQQKTVILIAHRLSTIRDVDEIAVMHHGRIIDQGSHDVLLSRPGLYRKMYELQREGSGDQ
jgi:ABC-type multidrug transport system fused ATPase/permease subunit